MKGAGRDMIPFDVFVDMAKTIANSGDQGDLAIGVHSADEGKLASYKVRSIDISDEDRRMFREVREKLTDALTSKFGVENVEQLPESVRNVLNRTDGNCRITSTDILELAKFAEQPESSERLDEEAKGRGESSKMDVGLSINSESTDRRDISYVYKQLVGEVNSRIAKLEGVDEKYAIVLSLPSKLKDNGPLCFCQFSESLQTCFNKSKTVGELRDKVKQTVKKWLGTDDKPSDLATTLTVIGKGSDPVGVKRLKFVQSFMRAASRTDADYQRVVNAAVVRLAIADSVRKDQPRLTADLKGGESGGPVSDGNDPSYMDADTRQSADYLLRRNDAKDNLSQLVECLTNCKVEVATLHGTIVKLAREKGNTYLSPAQVEAILVGKSYEQVRNALMRVEIQYKAERNYDIYLKQRFGLLPRDIFNGQALCKVGDFLEDDKHKALMVQLCLHLHSSSDASEAKGPGSLDQKYLKRLADFEAALRWDGNAQRFKTSPSGTGGQLYFDKAGMVQSANRHFGSSVPSTGEENYLLKLVFIDALRQNGTSETFLEDAKRQLGFGTDDETKPMSRRTAKELILGSKEPRNQGNPSWSGSVSNPSVGSRSGAHTNLVVGGGDGRPPSLTDRKIVAVPTKAKETSERQVGTNNSNNDRTQKAPAVQRSPSEVGINHANDYSDLWRGSADLLRRQILFALNSPDLRSGFPLRQLPLNGSVYDWLMSLVDSNPKEMVQQLSRCIKKMPGMADFKMSSDTVLLKLGEAIRAGVQKQLSDPVGALDNVARSMSVTVFGAGEKASGDDGFRPEVHQIGLMKNALVEAMIGVANSGLYVDEMWKAIIKGGGGLVCADSWSFKEGGKTYSSKIKPRADIERELGVKNKRELHLTGLSQSKLVDETGGRDLMTFLRFGEVVLNYFRDDNDMKSLYQELAEQMFLNNGKLLQEVKDGTREFVLPMVRTDLGGNELLQGPPDEFELTFKPSENASPVTVKIKPKVEHFCLPIDSVKETHVLLNKDEMELNKAAWKSMRERAEGYTGDHATEVKELVDQIDVYFGTVLTGESVQPYENFGAELTRLGARIGVLASLLGDVPAVNCNWGRDRTGAMDNEFKLTMMNVLAGEELPPIRIKPGEQDRWAAQRTRMLESTGNRQIAKQVNCTTHDLNLRQFRGVANGADGRKITTSGLPSLFHEHALPTLSMKAQSTPDVSAYGGDGKRKPAHTICRELLNDNTLRVLENAGGGHCFFYSAFAQMTREEKAQYGIDVDKLTADDMSIATFRRNLVTRLRRLRENARTDAKTGLYKEGDFY